jgi:hypothetical protein
VAQDVRAKVTATVERIAKLRSVRVPGHGIDGEVASRKRFVDRHAGIGLSCEARAGCAVDEWTGGNGNVYRQTLQLEHLEGFSDELDGEVFREYRVDLTGGEAGNFDVQIAGTSAEDEIA